MERVVFAQELQAKGVDSTQYIYEDFHREIQVLEGLLHVNQEENRANGGLWVVGDKLLYVVPR